MRKYCRAKYLILWVFFTVTLLSGQNEKKDKEQYNFKSITTSKGLSRTTVSDILQDSRGFLWFGTANGLNKYDGYSIKVYTDNRNEDVYLSDKGVLSLYEDKEGTIWIGLFDGVLNKYDYHSGKISHIDISVESDTLQKIEVTDFNGPLLFNRMSYNSITTITEDKFGNLWLGSWGNGIKIYSKKTGDLIHLLPGVNNNENLLSDRITDLMADTLGNIYVSTFQGGFNRTVLTEDPFKNDSKIIFENYFPAEEINKNKVFYGQIYNDGDSLLWVGSSGYGFFKTRINSPSKPLSFEVFNKTGEGSNALNSLSITAITADNEGYIWLGTFGGGITRFDPDDNSFLTFRHEDDKINTPADDEILCLYTDRSGIIWIGGHLSKGVNKLYRLQEKFEQITTQYPGTGLNDNVIWEIYQTEPDIYWIGTYKGGINIYNKRTDEFTYLTSGPNSLNDNHIRSITGDGKSIWIGTYSNGLTQYITETGEFRYYKHDKNDPGSIGGNQVLDIFIDSNRVCWVATFGGGLNRFELDDAYDGDSSITFQRYTVNSKQENSIPGNNVYVICEGNNDVLWLGLFGQGLAKFNKTEGTFISYKFLPDDPGSLSDNRVMAVHKDIAGYIWAGTYGGGLNRLDTTTGNFIRYNESNGFYSNVVYGILEDNRGNLWISSDNGIIKFNYEIFNISYFGLNDGLVSMEYSGGAYLNDMNGEMWFGGINGINHFFPEDISQFFETVPVVITNFKVFNTSVAGDRDKIEIDYSQNFFTVEFAVLDYNEESNYNYSYKLNGLDSEWHYAETGVRSVSYANLNPGYYKFRVRAVNKFGVWNTEEDYVDIIIKPPFWYTWWFIALAIIIVISAIIVLFKLRLDHLLAIERLKAKLAADLHDNIGAGLTEISILSELTAAQLKGVSPDSSKRLISVSETARNLIDSMSDIVWMVNPKRDTLHDLMIRLKDSYSDLLSEMGVAFRINSPEALNDIKLSMDYKQNLFLIFKEGIHNSIKHSGCTKIMLDARISGDLLVLSLKDDGKGFGRMEEYQGNGLKNIQERARAIGGLVMLRTPKEGGTEVMFKGKFGRLKKVKSFLSGF